MIGLRALAFDLQGTVVDFFSPIMRLGAAVNARKSLTIDWNSFSRAWRDLYREGMDAVIDGRRGWSRVDVIYREALDRLLDALGLSEHFSGTERDEINAVWTRLDPWPDSIAGLARLRTRFTVATLSNAGMASAIAIVKHAALPFDAVLTGELARAYKPAPAVYRLAVDLLGFAPCEIMMVACHKYDLRAAQALGMPTAFVARPLEFGPGGAPDTTLDASFDICARDFVDLASQLGT